MSGPPRKAVPLPGIQHIIAVSSGKGGVGKSTTAVNLAVALAAHVGVRTALLDADVHGPSLPRLMHLSGSPAVLPPPPSAPKASPRMVPLRNHGVVCMSFGFLAEEGAPVAWRGPMLSSALERMARETAWGQQEVLILDLPPGTGDAHITLAQRLPLAGAVIVTTPQGVAVADSLRGAAMLRRMHVPILGVVENMSAFLCGCGKSHRIFGQGGGSAMAKELDVPLMASVPLVEELCAGADRGAPIVLTDPTNEASQAYIHVAKKVWEHCRVQ